MTEAGQNNSFRAAFLASSYGTRSERFELTPVHGPPSPLFSISGHWAILTAYNPGGRQQAQQPNEDAQRKLEQQLSGLPHLPGINGVGVWAESSVIVTHLPLRAALRLGREFAQVAVLHGSGQRAALVWCASGRVERFWVSALVSGAGPEEDLPVRSREGSADR